MKLKSPQSLRRLIASAVVLGAAGLIAIAATPVKADDISSNAVNAKFIASLRGGAHINQNNSVKNTYGSLAGFGGLSYSLQQQPYVNRLSVAVDYMYSSKGGNTEQVIPIMLEYQGYQGVSSHVRPYLSFGGGLVTMKLKNTATALNGNGSTFGAFLGYGFDMPSQLFVEARYLLVPPLMGYNVSGPTIMAGIRF